MCQSHEFFLRILISKHCILTEKKSVYNCMCVFYRDSVLGGKVVKNSDEIESLVAFKWKRCEV